jgi:DNA repair protein RadC
MKLASLPQEERPRERLRLKGASSLSLAELLAVLLRTGSRGKDVLELASSILEEFGDARGLARVDEEELMGFPGLGEAKACVLIAALELGRRIRSERSAQSDGQPWEKRLAALAEELAGEDREYIVGGVDGAFLDVKYLLRRAVRLDSAGLVLVHNHPDGSLFPSGEDKMLTGYLAGRAKVLDIRFIGHYVAANGKYIPIPLPGEA